MWNFSRWVAYFFGAEKSTSSNAGYVIRNLHAGGGVSRDLWTLKVSGGGGDLGFSSIHTLGLLCGHVGFFFCLLDAEILSDLVSVVKSQSMYCWF